jgi:hypothetical protein
MTPKEMRELSVRLARFYDCAAEDILLEAARALREAADRLDATRAKIFELYTPSQGEHFPWGILEVLKAWGGPDDT